MLTRRVDFGRKLIEKIHSLQLPEWEQLKEMDKHKLLAKFIAFDDDASGAAFFQYADFYPVLTVAMRVHRVAGRSGIL